MLLISILFWSEQSFSAELPAPLSGYFRETWTTRSGLPHNAVNAITQTPEGYLWFGTWEGAVRYNGREFVNFDREKIPGLPDSSIRAMQLDRDGALLLGGSRGGLVRRAAGHWQPFEPAPALITSLLRDSQGRLWVATEGAEVLRIDPDGKRTYFNRNAGMLGDTGMALLEDDRGTVWIGTSEGLVYFEDNQLHALPDDSGLPEGPVLALELNQQKQLLVGTERGVFMATQAQSPTHFELLDLSLRGETITRLLNDVDGNLWIGTLNQGLMRFSARGMEHLGTFEGLPSSRVLSLFQDREKNMWVGTNAGLLRLSDAPFSNLTKENGLADNYVRSVLEHSDGSLWAGTSGGVSHIHAGKTLHIGVGTELENLSTLSLAEASNGDVWIGGYTYGALRLRNGQIVERRNRSNGLAGNEVRTLVAARDGTLWAGTSYGLSHVKPSGTINYDKSDGLPGIYVVSLMEDSHGAIWVGTSTGVATIDGDRIRSLDLMSSIQAEYVFALFEDIPGKVIWLATDRGLARYRPSDGQLQAVTRKHGLPFEKIFSITPDLLGNLWLSGNRGVIRIRLDDAHAVADGTLKQLTAEHFSESEGMASAQCNGGSGPSAALRHDGSVWIATAQGIAYVQPNRLSDFSATSPPVVIESFRVDDKTLDLAQDQQLPPGSQRIEMEFAGLSYVMSSRIQYRYRLIGFDNTWVERGTQKFAQFTNLNPGTYELRVSAAHPNGNWGTEEASLRFTVMPHFWQRPLFWVFAIFAGVALIYLLIRWRIRRVSQNAERLRDLVELKTADLSRQTDLLLAANEEKTVLLEQLRQQSEAFELQAREDSLTGLLNRRAFDEALSNEFIRANRSGRQLCLAILDVDHFKRVNDNWSHAVGDEALKAIARQMRSTFRSIDVIARWGGEEFAILLPDTSLEDARAICERLRVAIEAIDCSQFAHGLHLTASIGLTSHTGLSHHEKMLSRADAALYKAKKSGRNRICE